MLSSAHVACVAYIIGFFTGSLAALPGAMIGKECADHTDAIGSLFHNHKRRGELDFSLSRFCRLIRLNRGWMGALETESKRGEEVKFFEPNEDSRVVRV